MTALQTQKAKLAIAAALNSTFLYSPTYFESPENVRAALLHEVSDWFSTEPVSSGQHDKETTLEYIRTTPLPDLVAELDAMGKNPFSQITIPCVEGEDGKAIPMWEHFVSGQVARIDSMRCEDS